MLKLKPGLFLAITLGILGCSPSNPEETDTPKYKEYSNPEFGITLQYTPELEIDK
ncbi:hypothetical protein BAG01nite_08040 [Brevibacillus agri]|uniref:Uncharacterized protein n=1 Tax=Brevibacillus agri TaxID=51101 RepID=A0ABQ0SLE9_9BACL|nr:hypothetical protein BAG01nite_08040 [Brevibacillus agri]